MTREYSINSTVTTVSQSAKRRDSFSWGIKGYRPSTSAIYQEIRSYHQFPFDDRHEVRDEARWLALYCTDDDINLQFLMAKTKLRRHELPEFFAYYGVDLKRRNLIKKGERQ